MEFADTYDFDEIDLSAFDGDQDKFNTFLELRQQTLESLRGIEDTLLKCKFQVNHAQEVSNDTVTENQCEDDDDQESWNC